jgi:hypothetical protein
MLKLCQVVVVNIGKKGSKIGYYWFFTGIYTVYWKIHPPPPSGSRKYQPMSFAGNIWKKEEKTEKNVKEKGEKTKNKRKLKLRVK